MNNIAKDKYWDKPWSLVDGCTPCSPGCDHCWAAAMAHRFDRDHVTHISGHRFNGKIVTHPERLNFPLKRRKPTVFAVWNDLFHKDVPDEFIQEAFGRMDFCGMSLGAPIHTFLVLTKRPQRMADVLSRIVMNCDTSWDKAVSLGDMPHIYLGLTVCNQQEADEKIPIFLQIPGKKFLSIEPMLGEIDFNGMHFDIPGDDDLRCWHYNAPWDEYVDAVILGAETGPGARPMHPDWVRSVRDQCAAAGVPFFFKQWGEWVEFRVNGREGFTDNHFWLDLRGMIYDCSDASSDDCVCVKRVGRKNAGRLLDGRTHDDLPWRTNASA